jgi:hypothetical protein
MNSFVYGFLDEMDKIAEKREAFEKNMAKPMTFASAKRLGLPKKIQDPGYEGEVRDPKRSDPKSEEKIPMPEGMSLSWENRVPDASQS